MAINNALIVTANRYPLWLLACALTLISGCANQTTRQSNTPANTTSSTPQQKNTAPAPILTTPSPSSGSSTTSETYLYNQLNAQHKEWRGTPYQLGGLSKRGIDCSGYVQRTFRDRLQIDLPRTTALQSQLGIPVNRSQLQIGDLIFFKTGSRKTHVGIYMGNNKFMHASTSRGVIISKLDNIYWRDKYWKAKRVIR